MSATLLAFGQPPTLPPDFYGEALREAYGFWENTGWVRNTDGDPEPDIKYVTEGASPRGYIHRGAKISLVLADVDTSVSTMDTLHRLDIGFMGELVNAPDPEVTGLKNQHKNFHLPWCGPGGRTLVPGYQWMVYRDIYPNIDMYMYCGSRGQKFMLVIRPGGNPANIRLKFNGHDDMDLDVMGNLRLLLQDKWIVLPEAVAYQYDQNNTILPVDWTAEYMAYPGSGSAGFIFDEYDTTKPLVLLIGPPPMMGGPLETPGVCWAAYLGGDGEDQIYASGVDDGGNYYVTGRTYSQAANFPVFTGAVYTSATPKAFVTKFGPADNLLWSSLYGCSGVNQIGKGIAVKSFAGSSSVYIGGQVYGTDLPVAIPPGAWTDYGGDWASGFLAEFIGATGVLKWSTYFGHYGSMVNNVALDPQGRLVVTGYNSGDLPANTIPSPPGAESWGYGGNGDGFVSIITPTYQILWSTYFGTTASDLGVSVRCGPNKIVVLGRAGTTGLQTLDGGANAHDVPVGSNDLCLLEFDLNGDQQWGTYSGFALRPGGQGLAVHPTTGDLYVVGYTDANLLPISITAPWYDASNSVFTDGFVLRIAGADRSIAYATYVSATGSTELECVSVNADGDYAVSGITWDPNMGTAALPGLYTEDNMLGYGDAYLMVLTDQNWRAWSTYFGGAETDNHADMIRTLTWKTNGQLYAAGYTSAAFDQGQFFPLHDAGGGAWPDQSLDPVIDGFVASFCTTGILTRVADVAEASAIRLLANGTSTWELVGLGSGTHRYTVVDASGHLLLEGRSHGDRALIDARGLAVGTYVLGADDRWTRSVAIVR